MKAVYLPKDVILYLIMDKYIHSQVHKYLVLTASSIQKNSYLKYLLSEHLKSLVLGLGVISTYSTGTVKGEGGGGLAK